MGNPVVNSPSKTAANIRHLKRACLSPAFKAFILEAFLVLGGCTQSLLGCTANSLDKININVGCTVKNCLKEEKRQIEQDEIDSYTKN